MNGALLRSGIVAGNVLQENFSGGRITTGIKFYGGLLNLVNLKKFKIEDWDVGWYQLRMILKDKLDGFKLKILHNKLGEKILPQIYELGFLRDEVKYF